jgi:hypothetical protein
MFEKTFAFFLENFLSEFIEEGSWNQKNIQVGVWSGYIVLENLVRYFVSIKLL